MRARAVRLPDGFVSVVGSVLAADLRAHHRVVLRKGTRVSAQDETAFAALGDTVVHVVDLEPGELTQEEVARRLAPAIAGPGTLAEPPHQGQARLVATRRGLLRVRASAVRAVNALEPLLCFTLPDAEVVLEGDEVAGVKSAALATPVATLAAAEASVARGVVAVDAFAARRTLVLVTERLEARGRSLVADAIRRKLAWYGSELLELAEVPHEPDHVAEALRGGIAAGADLVLVSGANSLDPLDPALVALEALGGRVLRAGVPAHPGSMVWVGTLGATPVLGVATCAGFGKNTSLDLILPRVLAGEEPDDAAIELGHGGLVEGERAAGRFPPYERGEPSTLYEPARM